MPNILHLKLMELPADFEDADIFHGFEAMETSDLAEARSVIAEQAPSCALIFGQMPDMGWIELLEFVQHCDATLPVVFWDPEMRATDAVRLVRAGAFHCAGYRDSLDSVREHLCSAAEEKREQDRRRQRNTECNEPWRKFLVGRSRAMETVVETIRLIGARRCTVLIGGETGTGKEMAARALHMASPRAQYPFVAVNCNALPENLLEAELFGHTKGAFTGAQNARIGRFEQAHRGTIFLDEIGDMPLDLQAKLLRVLQEREVQRLGSSESIKLDVRVIAATNVDLPGRIKEGKFRQDLYYRLNVVPLQMPALRQRTDDIARLVAHFLEKVCRAEEIPVKRVTAETLRRLETNPWPGNVRQLENAVEMAVAMSGERETLYPSDFGFTQREECNVIPFDIGVPLAEVGNIDFNTAVARFERSMLERALAKTTGNKTAAAELLGLKRTTLIMKLQAISTAA